MKVRGLDAKSVDQFIAQFAAKMRESMAKTLQISQDVAVLVSAGSPYDQISGVQAAWYGQVLSELGPALGQVFVHAGDALLTQVEKKGDLGAAVTKLNMGNAEVFLHDSIQRVNGFSTELWETAKTQVTLGLQDGESIKEIAERIEGVVELKAAKAKSIAQTTVIAAINGGEYEQMKSLTATLGVQATKQWEATEDSHTRPTHAAADGQSVQLAGHFQVGDSLLRFPGDPTGQPGEVINCRCTTLYDIDVEDDVQASGEPIDWHSFWIDSLPDVQVAKGGIQYPIANLQDIPGAPISQPAVATNGALTAAFKEEQHPRGKDGKFIKKGVGLPGVLVDVLKLIRSGAKHDDLTPGEKSSSMGDILHITPKQWANLQDEDKQHIEELASNALNEGMPGSAKAVTHIDDLQASEGVDEEPDVFKPDTQLPSGAPKTKSPFEILQDTGENGDGYAAPGLWGKYGAAGVMIAAPGKDGKTRFLMVQRGPMVSSNKGKWQLAGGALNSKETPEQGAAREIFEEIGAPQEYLATMSKVGSHDVEVPIPGKKPWKYSNIVAEAPTMFDPKIDGTETGDAKWLTEDEINQLAADGKLHPALAKNLSDIFGVYHSGKSDVSTGQKNDVADVANVNAPPKISTTPKPSILAQVQNTKKADWDQLSPDEQKKLSKALHDYADANPNEPGVFEAVTKIDTWEAMPSLMPAATTTLAKAAPIKMTHGLIHAKHTPGTVIGMTKVPAGEVRVKWNGKEYEVQLRKSSSISWDNIPSTKVKKSALYAYLATNFANAQWNTPGKQNVDVNAPSVNEPNPPSVPVPTQDDLAKKLLSGAITLDEFEAQGGVITPTLVTKYGKITPPTLNAPATQLGFPSGANVTDDASEAYHFTEQIGTPSFHENGKYKIEFNQVKGVVLFKKNAKGEWDKGKAVDEGQIPLGKWGDEEPVAVSIAAPPASTAIPHPVGTSAPGPSAPKVAQKLDMTGWKKIGDQKGSNKAALFQAPDGTKYYVKSQKSKSHANNEVLAAAFYQAAGVEVPEVRHVDDSTGPWKNMTASKIIDGVSASSKLSNPSSDPKFIAQIQDGFAVDAWLSNWDVVGAGYDNIIDANGKPVRIDLGGSLLYRAMGSPKDSADFNDKVFELDSLKSMTMNTQAAKSFGSMTPDQERESAKKLLGITDDQIDQMVKDSGLDASLAEKLKKRRQFILDKYGLTGNDASTPASVPDVTPPVPTAKKAAGSGVPAPEVKGMDLMQLYTEVNDHIMAGEYTEGQTIALGKTAKFPKAEYRVIMGPNGEPVFQYKTDKFDWKTSNTPDAFEKIQVKWDAKKPTTPTAGPAVSAPSGAIDWAGYVNGATPGQMVFQGKDSKTGTDYHIFYVASKDEFNVWEDGFWSGLTYDATQVQNGELANLYPNVNWQPGPSATVAGTPGIVNPAAIAPTSVPSKLGASTPPLNTPSPTGSFPSTGITHLDWNQKQKFYAAFKAEKVSPAWSGAKIYNSIQVAKAQHYGDPAIAALTDEQMLQIVDEKNKLAKFGNPDDAYSKKVIEWLKTPNGKKAALAAKSGGWAHATAPAGAAKKTAPSISTKKTTAAKKATSKKLSVTDIIGTVTINDVTANTSQSHKDNIYAAVKAKPTGNSVKSPPAELFKSIHDVAKANGISEAEVLAIMDIETQKKYSKVSHTYGATIGAWINTPSGNKTAQEIKAGTYVPPVKKTSSYGGSTYGSSYGGVMAHAKDKPYSEKLETLLGDQIEKFDSSKGGTKDFPVLNKAQAQAEWSKITAGNPVTPSQKSSLKYYTSNAGYTAMNGYMRGQKGGTDATHKHVQNTQAGMRRLSQDVTFHRGASFFTGWGSYAEIKAREGTVWHEPAFFSASMGGKSAFGGSIGYIIEAPAGTPAALVIGKDSNYGHENEFFLAAGLKYQVVEVRDHGTSTTSGSQVTVVLRVVPDDTPSLNIVASASLGGA